MSYTWSAHSESEQRDIERTADSCCESQASVTLDSEQQPAMQCCCTGSSQKDAYAKQAVDLSSDPKFQVEFNTD